MIAELGRQLYGLTIVLAGYMKTYMENLAVAVILIFSIIVLFLIFRKSFIQGITKTGLKG